VRVEPTRDELLAELAEQRGFLAVSSAAFDDGDHAEAKRIAAALRTLLHDHESHRAVLVGLGTREQIGWLDTAGSLLPLVSGAQTPLVYIPADQPKPVWTPTLDAWDRRLKERPRLPPEAEETLSRMRAEGTLRSRGAWLPFAEWWDAHILRDMRGQDFSRADLVQVLANADGTVPADPGLAEAHLRLARRSSAGWAIQLERGPGVPLLSPALASMRQVAFEVERSLHRASPSPGPISGAGSAILGR
jgi:hypothetical protein